MSGEAFAVPGTEMVATLTCDSAVLNSITPEVASKYLSYVSHELNNNLNGVLLSLENLRGQFRDPASVDPISVQMTIDTATEVICDTARGMRQFLQLQHMRNNAAWREAGPVNLRELAGRMVRQFSPEAARKNLRLEADVRHDAVITSRRELIALVLQNLVGNAVKYSVEGTVRIIVERDTRWVLSVVDEGPGIAQEQLRHIFKAFRRGEAHGQTGIGLGLTVVAEAARLLDAEITVDSEPCRGSTFRLWFPAHAEMN